PGRQRVRELHVEQPALGRGLDNDWRRRAEGPHESPTGGRPTHLVEPGSNGDLDSLTDARWLSRPEDELPAQLVADGLELCDHLLPAEVHLQDHAFRVVLRPVDPEL